MKTNLEIINEANALYINIQSALKRAKEEHAGLLMKIGGNSVEEDLSKVDSLMKVISSVIASAQGDTLKLPDFLCNVKTTDENTLSSVVLTVSSKLKAEDKFKTKAIIDINESLIDNMAKVFTDTLFNEYYMQEGRNNLYDVNAKIRELNDEYGISKTIEFVCDGGSDVVADITDSVIKLRVVPDMALRASEMGIMTQVPEVAEGEENVSSYEALIYNEAVKAYVNSMSEIKITPQVLKGKIPVVEELVDLHTKKRVNKIIRKNYHKQAGSFKDNQTGIGYFNEKVDDVDVFALVRKNEDGSMEYVLSPFDVVNLKGVDIDVISKVQAG